MKRKFRLRIWKEDHKYYLQYAYYLLWPTWHFIYQFSPARGSSQGPIEGSYDKLVYTSSTVAEVEARRFDTIEKVLAYIKEQHKLLYSDQIIKVVEELEAKPRVYKEIKL